MAQEPSHGKRHRTPSEESEFGPEGQYEYVPKCDYCKDRGLTCRAVQNGHRCDVCKAKKVRCSALQKVVKPNKDSGTEKAWPSQRTLVDMFRAQDTGLAACPPSKRQRVFVDVPPVSMSQAPEQAAVTARAADSSESPSRSTTPTLAMTTRTTAPTAPVLTPTTLPTPDTRTTPRPVMVDKAVGTESQPSEHRDAEFMKAFRMWLKGEREGNA